MITTSNFRDGHLVGFAVTYDWDASRHAAELTLRTVDGTLARYRIVGLRAWHAYEDFEAQWIERCTLIHDEAGVYLCLDPHHEGVRTDDDNLWMLGAAVERCD